MKVLHISSPKTWRGGEQQLIYLVEELNSRGVEQLVMCPFNSVVHKYCLKKHLPHITYFKGFSANPMVAYKVAHVCKREKIDLIHTHDSHSHNFAVLSSVLAKNQTPIIVSRRVDFPLHSSVSGYKYNYKRVSRILCVSEAIKEVMSPFIEDQSKLAVVHSGIDLNRFVDVKVEKPLREELGLAKDDILVGNVSALAPHKDYPTFLNTVKELKKAGVKAKYLAIGEGPSRKEIETLIESEELQDDVHLLGFRTDVPAVLSQLNAFLITSETEGLGTSILDAFAMKIPVIATRAGGITELVEHEQTGLLSDVKDAKSLAKNVERLLSDTSLMDQLTEGATERLQQFTKEMTAQKTLAIYEEVLSEPEEDESS